MRQLGKLVVTQNQVHAIRKLTLQRANNVNKLMGLVAAVIGVMAMAVDQLLQDKVSPRVAGQIGDQQNLPKGWEVAMQISHDHQVFRSGAQGDQPANSTGGRSEQVECFANLGQNFRRVGHR